MILNRLCLVLTGFAVLCGCASTPNLMYGSHCRAEFRLSKSDHILLALPPNSQPAEQRYLPVLRESFLASGFRVVDTVAEADLLVTLYVVENGGFTQVSTLQDDALNRGFVPRINTVEARVDSGFTHITLVAFSAKEAQDGKPVVAWEATVSGLDNHFRTDAPEILAKVIHLYGKNAVRREVYRPQETGR